MHSLVDKSINWEANGCRKLVKKYKRLFLNENTGLYDEKDYEAAERKYIKGILDGTIPAPRI
jgi:hypothetical protein